MNTSSISSTTVNPAQRIKQIWSNLSDDEISFNETKRDLFFIAIREKYNIPRAQAEEILRNL